MKHRAITQSSLLAQVGGPNAYRQQGSFGSNGDVVSPTYCKQLGYGRKAARLRAWLQLRSIHAQIVDNFLQGPINEISGGFWVYDFRV